MVGVVICLYCMQMLNACLVVGAWDKLLAGWLAVHPVNSREGGWVWHRECPSGGFGWLNEETRALLCTYTTGVVVVWSMRVQLILLDGQDGTTARLDNTLHTAARESADVACVCKCNPTIISLVADILAVRPCRCLRRFSSCLYACLTAEE